MTQVTAGTNGFLFCDLRGYTSFVERHGDQAAAELLSRYRAIVRAVIAQHAGAEVRTEGDSVYVVFPAASAAVEAGLEIVRVAAADSDTSRPIRVGVGIHAGETVATTEGLVGGAVNIAARVCAKAQPGEVLVTDTVRALTRTFLPYRYTSLGTQQLKGIAGGIPLFRVEAVPGSAWARLARQLRARRGRLVLVAGLGALLLVAAGGAYALNRPPDCLSLTAATKDVVARIDPTRNCVVATYPVGQRPGPVVVSDGIVWVANVDDETLTWIDLPSKTAGTTAAGGPPIDMAAQAGSIVVLDHTARTGVGSALVQDDQVAHVIDNVKRMVVRPALLPDPRGTTGNFRSGSGVSGYQSVALVGDHAWVTNDLTGQVISVPVDGGGATATTIEPLEPLGATPGTVGTGVGPLAVGQGVVWIGNLARPVIYRLDGVGGRSIQTALDGDAGVIAIDPTVDTVWLLRSDGRLTRVNPIGGAVQSFDIGGDATALSAGASAIWVLDQRAGTIRRIDPATGLTLVTIPVGGQPRDLATAPDGTVWVTIAGP